MTAPETSAVRALSRAIVALCAGNVRYALREILHAVRCLEPLLLPGEAEFHQRLVDDLTARELADPEREALGLTPAQYAQVLANLHESLRAREPLRFGAGPDAFTYRWRAGEGWEIHLGPE